MRRCIICDGPIPSARSPRAITCSPACYAVRARENNQRSYQKRASSPQFLAARAALARARNATEAVREQRARYQAERYNADPEWRAHLRAYQREHYGDVVEYRRRRALSELGETATELERRLNT